MKHWNITNFVVRRYFSNILMKSTVSEKLQLPTIYYNYLFQFFPIGNQLIFKHYQLFWNKAILSSWGVFRTYQASQMKRFAKLGSDCYVKQTTDKWLSVLPERRMPASFSNLEGIESISTNLLAAKLWSDFSIYFAVTRLIEKI